MRRDATLAKPAVLSFDESMALAKRVIGMISGPQADVSVGSGAATNIRFTRGDAHMARSWGATGVIISIKGAMVRTNQLDDANLRLAVGQAEAAAKAVRTEDRPWNMLGPQQYATPPKLFFESVDDARSSGAWAELVDQALDATEAAGLIGAGTLDLSAGSHLVTNTAGLVGFSRGTTAEFSLTARTKDGMGSGWAWSGRNDWARVDVKGAIARAVDLAQRSAKPVAVEPGRYTVILEAEAMASLLAIDWGARSADGGYSVFSKDPRGQNKIGLQMIDQRLGIVADPWDPEIPQSTMGPWGDPVGKVDWFEGGVLKDLYYDKEYAREKQRAPVFAPWGFRLYAKGPPTSLEDMIASTKRGIWVNRFSNISQMNGRTVLLSGTTRDGTFLIENGKITKAIKNLRFTESPFFALNKLEAWGESVRTSANMMGQIAAPRVKIRDFDFTSLTDAI